MLEADDAVAASNSMRSAKVCVTRVKVKVRVRVRVKDRVLCPEHRVQASAVRA